MRMARSDHLTHGADAHSDIEFVICWIGVFTQLVTTLDAQEMCPIP